MSIFNSPSFSDWTPVVSTAAPMTITAVTIVFAKYALIGSVCQFIYSVSFTIGGVVAVQVISVSLPVVSSAGLTSAFAVANTTANGAVVVGRSRVLLSTQTIDTNKTNGAGDVAWVAGAGALSGSGFYPIA